MQITGAIYHSPVHYVGGLPAEFSAPNGGGLEVTAALLPYDCCKGLLDCMVNLCTYVLV